MSGRYFVELREAALVEKESAASTAYHVATGELGWRGRLFDSEAEAVELALAWANENPDADVHIFVRFAVK